MDLFDDQPLPSQLCFERGTRDDGTACLAVSGEIDMMTGDVFRQTLLAALGEPAVRRLVLDIGALRFMDSNGVGVLVKARRTADERGIGFAIVNARGPVRGVLEMLGVYEMLAAQT
jgi:anti-sigma B factor antagonist